MRILFVSALHHPQELQKAVADTPPDAAPPLFPPSTSQHFQEKAFRKRGHVMDVFYRNLPVLGGKSQMQRYSQRAGPMRAFNALMRRLPASLNPDLRWRNQRLIKKALAFEPEVIWLTGDNSVIFPETLAVIKEVVGCKLIYACGTSPVVFSHPIERRAARLYDMVLTNDYYHGIQWLELGAKRMECLPLTACDPDFHRPYDLSEAQRKAYTCEVAFVGTLVPDNLYHRRVEALEALRDFDLGIWSVHEVPTSLKKFVRGAALGQTMMQIMSAAKITINTHGDFMRYGGNMRLFEAAGVEVFQIADDLPGVYQWFTESETIVTYRDLEDLRRKVEYYLTHDEARTRIAQCARQHVYENHTYEQRTDRFEALLKGL